MQKFNFYLRTALKENIVLLSGKSLDVSKINFSKKNIFIINNYGINTAARLKKVTYVLFNDESLHDFIFNYDLSENQSIITTYRVYLKYKLLLQRKNINCILFDYFEKKAIKYLNFNSGNPDNILFPNSLLVLLFGLKIFNRKIYLYGCDGIDKIESFEDTYHKDIIKYHSTVFKKKECNIFKDQLVLNERVNKKDFKNVINMNPDSKITSFPKFKY